jgi:hypothetical protein
MFKIAYLQDYSLYSLRHTSACFKSTSETDFSLTVSLEITRNM